MLSLLALLLACGTSTDAWDVSYKPAGDADVDTVKQALDELYVKCRDRDEPGEERAPVGSDAENLALRVQVLELKVQQLETVGVYDAAHVSFDPARTTLAGKSVQDALSELEGRVGKVEAARTDMGQPGTGLFEIPKDAPRGGADGQLPPNTMGKGKPGGPPSGGQGGGPGGGQGGGPGGG
ncbi:MAG: hypothetical protein FJ102_06830, partial [Deltaproteobacteria bacterium]|nr:hypothetical protein [Deltaproteobacteria bacterium]